MSDVVILLPIVMLPLAVILKVNWVEEGLVVEILFEMVTLPLPPQLEHVVTISTLPWVTPVPFSRLVSSVRFTTALLADGVNV